MASSSMPAAAPYIPTVEAAGRDAVPVVDMRDPDAARAVARAAEEWGAFLLVGHGVQPETVARAEEQLLRLFELPAPERTRGWRRPGEANAMGPYASHLAKLMWSEGYTFPATAVRSVFRRVWPDGGDDYVRFCEVMEEYNREMRALSGKLLHVLFRALGLTDEQIVAGETERKISDTSTAIMRLNLYPKCPDQERAIGLQPHTDSCYFTFVTQNLVPGLQLLRRAPDRWVTVPALPGAIAVLVDDLFHVLSNGRFHNVVHRAVANSERQRISVINGVGPPADLKVAPLPSAVLPGTKAAFRAVTWPEYMALQKKMFGTADESALDMLQVAGEEEEEH